MIYECPKCDRPKECTPSRYRWYVERKSLCKSCHLKKMRSMRKPHFHTEQFKEDRRQYWLKNNPAFSDQEKKRRSERMKGDKNPSKRLDVRRKIRLSVIKSINERYEDNIYPMYNKIGCKIIEEYGKEHGYSFQHALNGGEFFIEELGYWVDGYDKKNNVVIEYYEKSHRSKKDRDKRRKQEIINHLGCEFIEIKEWEI